tara:strand:+ start:780 stop:1025 length:246 start_codon:yes stop_codon:yes gene_type:complete
MKRLKKGEKRVVPNWDKYLPLKKIVDTNTPKGWDIDKVTLVEGDYHPTTHVEVIFVKENRDHVKATFSGGHIRNQLHKFVE